MNMKSLKETYKKIKNLEKNVSYVSFFLDPETGEKYPDMKVIPDSKGDWNIPRIPIFKDLLLVIEKKG